MGLTQEKDARENVVKHVSDRIAIMYLGRVVEAAEGETVYRDPRHPYTQSLISAIPIPDPHRDATRQVLTGDVPSPINPPSGCRFHPRCPKVMDECKHVSPVLTERTEGHIAACHLD